MSCDLMARLAASSSKGEGLWQLLSILLSVFCSLLKRVELLSEPESSSSESEFLLHEVTRRRGGRKEGEKELERNKTTGINAEL